MKFPLERRFPEEISVLEDLFGHTEVQVRLPRLNDIFNRAENAWRNYVAQIPNGRVKYLLIAEAPPWSVTGVAPQYVLDPSSRPRTLMRALRKAFLPPNGQLKSADALAEFARQSFLLVDSIPFAMDYSPKRGAPNYDKLVGLSARSFLQETLKSSSLVWSSPENS